MPQSTIACYSAVVAVAIWTKALWRALMG